jgi:hypothetical protein
MTIRNPLMPQLARLEAVTERLRQLAASEEEPDALLQARLLVLIDNTCRRLNKLASDADPDLFNAHNGRAANANPSGR